MGVTEAWPSQCGSSARGSPPGGSDLLQELSLLGLLPAPTADRLPLRAGHGVHPVQVPLPGSPAITRLPSSPLGPVALLL